MGLGFSSKIADVVHESQPDLDQNIANGDELYILTCYYLSIQNDFSLLLRWALFT